MSDAAESYSPTQAKAPQSLLEFMEYLVPVLKYYVVLLVFYLAAKYINRALDEESQLQEKENLQARMDSSSLSSMLRQRDSNLTGFYVCSTAPSCR